MTKIQWVKNPDGTQGKTWNPVVGCTKKSSGCRSCYALRMAWRLLHNPNPKISSAYQGVVEKVGNVIRWTGRVNCLSGRLGQPLSWKKGQRIFVPSMGDLLHENVPDEFIFDVLTIIAKCPQHTFQLLTKRAGRLAHLWRKAKIDAYPNLWIGVSAENQATADERILLLLQTPAVVRFVSCEPLLSEIILENAYETIEDVNNAFDNARPGERIYARSYLTHPTNGLNQVIVGCETGPGARPMELDWARSLRDQCQQADVAFFYKQGPDPMSFRLKKATTTNVLDGKEWKEMPDETTS